MRASHYFTAAAITLLLGAVAIPNGALSVGLYAASGELVPGIYGVLVIVIAIAAPIPLLLAGLLSLWFGPPPGGNRS